MPTVPVNKSDISQLEKKDLDISDFKPLYKEDKKKGALPSHEEYGMPPYPTNLSLPLSEFSELLKEKPGDDIMLVVKGPVKSISENTLTIDLEYAALVHGKKLSSTERKGLSKLQFAIPEKEPGSGSYPIPDKAHARNALARVSQHGSSAEKAKVRAAVKKKFPDMDMKSEKKKLFGR